MVSSKKTPPPPLVPPVRELMPGDVVVAEAGQQLKTLLGSCVSVILTDPRRTVGAMCHIVHVGQPNASNLRNTAYGVVALQAMFDQLQQRGVMPTKCQAYVYGGGNMFPQLFGGKHVGTSNSEWVLAQLHALGMDVVDEHVGGNGYRKVSWTIGPQEPVVETVFPEQGVGYDR
jgi:chemotaxis protein CheD